MKVYKIFFKRLIDIMLSCMALLIFSPILIFISILVKLKLGSPIFFVQLRPGKNEKLFKMYKFRTMTSETTNNGEPLSDEYRLTKFGKFLRLTSLDELPELFNIIKGDMSIVGPRPILVDYLPLYNVVQRRRHNVTPGLTGLAQISGRNTISWEEKFQLDVLYAQNISFFGDIKIIMKTFLKVIRKDGINQKDSNVPMTKFQGSLISKKPKKNVWILNHYATDMFFYKAGRHYWIAKELQKKGYNPIIICASTNHNLKDKKLNFEGRWKIDTTGEVPFLFIKCRRYTNNGLRRIANMLDFYFKVTHIIKHEKLPLEKPDIIYASSVHPLTLVAGINIANHYGRPCLSEVRDLWPESIVAYSKLTKKNILIKILYQGEKWIYAHSDKIIMTWAGGKYYIKKMGWNNIPEKDVVYISNGVLMEEFDYNKEHWVYESSKLKDSAWTNIVYTGSIREVNNIDFLLDLAKTIDSKSDKKIRFLIFGSGDKVEAIEERILAEKISNVLLMGSVEKKYIPSILSQSDINILHNKSTILDEYGQSQNKLFEYLAAGKPIVQTYKTGYSILEKYQCGIVSENQTVDESSIRILELINDISLMQTLGKKARDISFEYDFSKLTNRLIELINSIN